MGRKEVTGVPVEDAEKECEKLDGTFKRDHRGKLWIVYNEEGGGEKA